MGAAEVLHGRSYGGVVDGEQESEERVEREGARGGREEGSPGFYREEKRR
jgi:hypothetical protein